MKRKSIIATALVLCMLMPCMISVADAQSYNSADLSSDEEQVIEGSDQYLTFNFAGVGKINFE